MSKNSSSHHVPQFEQFFDDAGCNPRQNFVAGGRSLPSCATLEKLLTIDPPLSQLPTHLCQKLKMKVCHPRTIQVSDHDA